MAKYETTLFGSAVWNVMLSHVAKDDLPIYYGELSQQFYGHKRAGRAFRYPLGEIHFNIKKWNSRKPPEARLPFLNGAVVNTKGAPGAGYPGTRPNVPNLVEQIRSIPVREWINIGNEFGYKNGVIYKVGKTNRRFDLDPNDDFGDFGAKGNYKRSVTWVVPKHHPACKAVQDYLKSNHALALKAKGVRPDFFVEYQNETYVIEVKPNTAPQSIACGVGQLLVYGASLKADRLVLAIPEKGQKIALTSAVRDILKAHEIGVMSFKYSNSKKACVTSLKWGD